MQNRDGQIAMKKKITLFIIVLLLFLLIITGGFCSLLLFWNKTLNEKWENEKQSNGELQKKVTEYQKKTEQQEKRIKDLQNALEKASSKVEKPGNTEKNKNSETIEYVDITDMEHAEAKGLVNPAAIDQNHLEEYFKSFPISDELFDRIHGDDRSYKNNCDIPLENLAYIKLLHYDYNGKVRVGELISSSSISGDLLDIFRKLYENRYPIEKMVLIEAYGADDDASVNDNNTSCFNFRYATDSTTLSRHATGNAIDINPLQNPYFRILENGEYDFDNTDANLYWDRSNDPENRHMITHDDLCYKLFMEHGFTWGGDWQNPIDYQHFEKL